MHITDIEMTTHSSSLREEVQEMRFKKPKKKKSSNQVKGLLYTLFILLAFNGNSNFAKYSNLILYVFMLIIQRRIRFDFIVLFIAVTITIVNIFTQTNDLFYAQFMTSLTLFTFDSSKRMIRDSMLVWKEIKNLISTMIFVTILWAYVATSYYKDNINALPYFSTFGRSILSLVQALSLDDWAQLGRETNDLFGYILLCSYILLMTYFYINILMGLLIDTLQNDAKGIMPSQDPFNYETTQQQLYIDLIVRSRSKLDEWMIGKYYEWIIYIITFSGVTISILNNFDVADSDLDKIFNIADDFIYTIHFFLLLLLHGPIYDVERKSIIMMTLHFLAGPISLLGTLFFELEIGCLFNILKMATTQSIKGIFRGTIQMIPLLTPQFTELLGILMFIASILTCNYFYHQGPKMQNYFSSFWGSVYTMIQIMTLDDWGTIVSPMYEKYTALLPYIIVTFYIFLSNFIILNTLIALSCEYFVEIKYVQIDRLDKIEKTMKNEIVGLDKIQDYCNQHQINFQLPQVIINQNDELGISKLKLNDVIQLQYQNQIIPVQVTQHSDAL